MKVKDKMQIIMGMKPIIYKHADMWCVGDDGDNDCDRGIDITCDASQMPLIILMEQSLNSAWILIKKIN